MKVVFVTPIIHLAAVLKMDVLKTTRFLVHHTMLVFIQQLLQDAQIMEGDHFTFPHELPGHVAVINSRTVFNSLPKFFLLFFFSFLLSYIYCGICYLTLFVYHETFTKYFVKYIVFVF